MIWFLLWIIPCFVMWIISAITVFRKQDGGNALKICLLGCVPLFNIAFILILLIMIGVDLIDDIL